jgi:hypothetical protein
MIPLRYLWLGLALGLAYTPDVTAAPQGFEHFVRREGDKLFDGDLEFRFISVSIPNLHYIDDDMRFDRSIPFRFPDESEIDDALETVSQLGGQVLRMYALSVRKPDDPAQMPRHILGPGRFSEEAFTTLDRVIAAAHRHKVRLVIPLIDQWSWWGGTAELAGFRNKPAGEFWTDQELIKDYGIIVGFLLNRVNTVTGVPYREDKAILAWETGDELAAPDTWIGRAAAIIKGFDRNHLVVDGAQRPLVPDASLDDPNVDLVQTHHYERDPRQILDRIRRNAARARGRKPYYVGEFGFLPTESLKAVIDLVIDRGMTGAMLWGIRYHNRDGGFYWHHEPAGGDPFQSYHWPGFASGERYDERRVLKLLRDRAYRIRGLLQVPGDNPPPLPRPAPPKLLEVSSGGLITWRGSTGAEDYQIERTRGQGGPWEIIATGVSDADVQYHPLYSDETASPLYSYSYRALARNGTGLSDPSNVLGPVQMDHHTLVDEFSNDARIFLREGKLTFRQNEARKFREDCHRLTGEPGSAIVYHGASGIRKVRVFAFSQSEQPELEFATSFDARAFQPASPLMDAAPPSSGKDLHGAWNALLYTLTVEQPGSPFLRIEFRGPTQVGRIEVEYGDDQRG